MQDTFLLHSFVFLAATCCIVPLAYRFKLGSVIGYLATGFLIGPFGTGWMGNSAEVIHFAEFGVILMLFLIGLELEPSMLWRLRSAILGLGGLQIALTTLLIMLVGWMLGFPIRIGLVCGLALSLSSTAIVLQLLEEKKLFHTTLGQYSFSILLFQDIAVIPILILIPFLAAQNFVPIKSDLAYQSVWHHTFIVITVISSLFIMTKYFSRYFFNFIARSQIQEIFTATALGMVVGITLIMEYIDVSPALGAFVGGVVLANSEYKHTIESDIKPFKGLLLGLFFVSIGMGMNLSVLKEYPFTILGCLITLLFVKVLVLFILGRFFKLPILQNISFALLLAQGSEFAFVLIKFISNFQILTPKQADVLGLTVTLSMAMTPILIILVDRKIVPLFLNSRAEPTYDEINDDANPVIIAGYGRFGQIIGRFLNAQHIHTTILENDAAQLQVIRRYGKKAYYGDGTRIDILRNAGAQRAKVLIIAIDDLERSVQIAQLAKKEFPNLKIFARARNRKHAYELYNAKVDYVRRETFDSSIKVANQVMKVMGFQDKEIESKTRKFIAHDERSLQESFKFFDKEQENELISFTIKSGEELEQILKDDLP